MPLSDLSPTRPRITLHDLLKPSAHTAEQVSQPLTRVGAEAPFGSVPTN